jgi:hypothetical protein
MASPTKKLRDLTAKRAGPEYQEAYDKQTGADADDRSFCLLLASMLENELERNIDSRLGDAADTYRDELYGGDGPLGTFSRKEIIAAACGILGPISKSNFKLVRSLRNAFAHAKIPITFETPEIVAVCAGFKRINIFDPPEAPGELPKTAREQFSYVVHETMLRLARNAGHDPKFIDDQGKPRNIDASDLP